MEYLKTLNSESETHWNELFEQTFSKKLQSGNYEWSDFAILEKSHTVFYLHDFPLQRNRYVSENFERVTGYPRQRCLEESYFMMKIIHPEDLNQMYSLSKLAFDYLDTLSKKRKKDCILRFNYRIVKPTGAISWLMDQLTIVEFDNDGKPKTAAGSIVEISHLKPKEIYCLVETTDGCVHQIQEAGKVDISFSKREVELLQLIDKGLSSKEIASFLKISINTVHNHRRNMMQRFRTHNMIEVLKIAKESGRM